LLDISVKFVADELFPGLENGVYKAAEGTTVRGLLEKLQSEAGTAIPEHNYKLMYPMFDGKPIKIEAPLNKSGTLHMCRVVMGG